MKPTDKVCGIVAEYNPFHSGHRYQISALRRLGYTHIVAVMSGNFVQRGDLAIWDKWNRARSALEQGVDLVIELPTPWAMATAERFAQGAIALLNSLGCVDAFSFGCECGSVEKIQKCAALLEAPSFSETIRPFLTQGLSFAGARQKAVELLSDKKTAALLSEPNNILGIEYCKAARRLQSKMLPIALPRQGVSHDSDECHPLFASASLLRQKLTADRCPLPYLSKSAWTRWQKSAAEGNAPALLSRLELPILSTLRGMTAEQCASLPDLSEGLEHRLLYAAQNASSLEEIFQLCKSKRYSLARIRRLTLSAYLGLSAEDCLQEPPYLRVLGMNLRGRELLHLAKTTAALPLLVKPAHISDSDKFSEYAQSIFRKEQHCTDCYALAFPKIRPVGWELTENPIVIHS